MPAFRRFCEGLLPVGPEASNGDYLLGYIGLWQVVDDAHVVSIGVRTPFRRHGVGEALADPGYRDGDGVGVKVRDAGGAGIEPRGAVAL